MNILFHTALAFQPFQNMVKTMMKIGAFNGGTANQDTEECVQITIEHLFLLQKFEQSIPSFYNPDLKLFLLLIAWDDNGNFLVTPQDTSGNPHQFVFGNKNSRRLKSPKLELLTQPFRGAINLVAWGMEAKEGSRFADIRYKQIAKLAEESKLRQLVHKNVRMLTRPKRIQLETELERLRLDLPLKLPFIEKLHPIFECSFSTEKAKLISEKNQYVQIAITSHS